MKPKRRKVTLLTPDERAAQLERLRALEERTRLAEAELEAAGSVYAGMPREQRLAFATARIEAELAAKKQTT